MKHEVSYYLRVQCDEQKMFTVYPRKSLKNKSELR